MKCACGDQKCTGEYGFDGHSGMLRIETDSKLPGTAGVYIDVQGAAALSRQLQEFVLRKMRAEVEP